MVQGFLHFMTTFLLMTLAASLGPMGPDAPAHEPQMVTRGPNVMMTFGAGKQIYFSVSRDGGETFSDPVRVAEGAVLPLTRHRGPRIALAGGAIVITAVTGKTLSEGPHAHGLPTDGDLIAWRSVDGGKSWSKGVIVNDVPGAPTEGLHALASDPKGNLFAAWLDKRSGKGTKLYGAHSTDGVHWSKNVLIYDSPEGTICECCHPSAAIDADGQILVMWRNWLGGARDMYLAKSRDGVTFSNSAKVGDGSWQLNACPMDGGGLAASGKQVVTAWRRGEQVYIDEPGQPEKLMGAGKDVAIAVSHDKVYAIWMSAGAIVAWAAGKSTEVAKSGAFPSLTSLADGGVLAAWEENGAIVTRRLAKNLAGGQTAPSGDRSPR
jgi:hypothetical protein